MEQEKGGGDMANVPGPEPSTAASQSWMRIGIVVALVGAIVAFFAFDLQRYTTLEFLKSQQANFQSFYAEHMVATIALYAAIYITVAALSLPGAAILTLAGGALFGFGVGLVVVSFASTIGATCAFLVARFLLRDWVQERFGERLRRINAGVERDGAFYLFTLRLVAGIPFFVINLAMGLTPIRTSQFFIVSQIGMLPGTAVYVNAGTQLSQIDSLAGILSLPVLLSFALLGLLPLVAKKVVEFLKARRDPPAPSNSPAA